MSDEAGPGLSRRQFLAGTGLFFGFTLFPSLGRVAEKPEGQNAGVEPKKAPKLPGSLETEPMLDAWIRIDPQGGVTVITGKVEIGQGIKTALMQVAAEQLKVGFQRVRLVTADTAETPNEAYTAGSQSMPDSATAIMHAAAQVRAILVDLAARRFGVDAASLVVSDGLIEASDGRRVRYGELVEGQTMHVRATQNSPLLDPAARVVMGKSIPRVDIPAKITGQPIYVQDLRLPGMVHARVVRPPSYAARLERLDASGVENMPGVLRVVRNGSFLAVVAEGEWQAIKAMKALARAAKWTAPASLPQQSGFYDQFVRLKQQRRQILSGGGTAPAGQAVEASYRRPYQMHGSIGPSCAVGLSSEGVLSVWTHSQGVFPLRGAIAQMVGLKETQVRCIHMEGSGCYGHNGADDAAADAALIALAFPGKPVRVQWMREDEHRWEPYGSAMVASASARLQDGKISSWRFEVWSCSHLTRPGGMAGNLLPAWHLEKPFELPMPKPLPQPAGGGDRNAVPYYAVPHPEVVHHFVTDMPLRVSALRALGGYLNVFALESFMDELAVAAKADPVSFRLLHLEDARAQEVVRSAAERFGWAAWKPRSGRGRGFAFARYKNLAAYCAIAMEVEVDRSTGRVRVHRVNAAIDSGEAVNPDGIANQTEGGIIQSISWTLYESVRFDQERITTHDWAGYPILRFGSVPGRIDVHVINRPGEPFLGTGEAAQGPAAAALANAVANASGQRIRELPLSHTLRGSASA